MRTALAHAAALVIALSASAAAAQSDHRIVPGELIGVARIGMHLDDLVAALGRAARVTHISERADGMIRTNLLLTDSDPGLLHVSVSSRSEQVTDVATEDASDATAQGIRIGSPAADVTRTYGTRDEETVASDDRGSARGVIMRYRSLGLYFGVRDGLVFRIGVTRPH